MTRPMPIKAVLFDRDDTIAYTDRSVYREAAHWLAQQYSLNPRQAGETLVALWQERGQEWWHMRSLADEEQFWEAYGLELTRRFALPAEAAPVIMSAYPYERYMKPAPHAREVMQTLRHKGLRIGVLSNTLPSIDVTLRAVGLDELVDVALATCLLGVHKPDPQAFVLAAEALGVQPDETLFVDDKLENVQAAQNVGMQATLIDHSGQQPDAIHDLRDVLRWVGT